MIPTHLNDLKKAAFIDSFTNFISISDFIFTEMDFTELIAYFEQYKFHTATEPEAANLVTALIDFMRVKMEELKNE